ncbi:hypothetical protein SAMN03080598_01868 [Algoriphagus boritolerans DSM 17298 = JCM 18970]|uniref:Uncharacterized protein n=1 Tax=Algoriphagus boritolerans DSM 17298 = JCM 18970 TaxID=1120964 RepID=A0A1H5VXI4_9BACT|nr:hypothetical protein SAMN03080598_01868 [Algoriphagus boritolerans DSM 17298 = JCM 18970]
MKVIFLIMAESSRLFSKVKRIQNDVNADCKANAPNQEVNDLAPKTHLFEFEENQ